MIIEVLERFSYDGRSNENNVTNKGYYKTDVPITSADWAAAIANLTSGRRTASLASLHFMDTRITNYMNDNHTPADGDFRTFVHAGVGARAVVGQEVARHNYLKLNRLTGNGRLGRLEMRGLLLESDVTRAVDGSILVNAPAASNAAALAVNYMANYFILPVQGAWVIPRPPRKRHLAPRTVTSLVNGGVGQRQRHHVKTSVERAEVELAQRKINKAAGKAYRLMDENPGFLNIPGVFNLIWEIASLIFEIRSAVPALLRGAVVVPPRILALPAPGA